MIVLYNRNTYLGGGETLLVRFADYLAKRNIDFLVVCSEGSFIQSKLAESERTIGRVRALAGSADYYYLGKRARAELLDRLAANLPEGRGIRLVSFCMRDLYVSYELSRRVRGLSLIHLILHIQDDLYLGQSVSDKLIYAIFRRRRFSGARLIDINRNLLRILNQHNGLICMAQLINEYWRRSFGLSVESSGIIPLPLFQRAAGPASRSGKAKSIVWIGRVVDFKIPAIFSLIEFLAHNIDYTCTIIGGGRIELVHEHIRKTGIDKDRVNLPGEVAYSMLGEAIRKHSIGYAMGTSLVELAQMGLPVIVALASYDHKHFARPICGGLFYDQQPGCDGSELMLNGRVSDYPEIADVVHEIEADYDTAARRCYHFAQNGFSLDNNFQKYLKRIRNTVPFGREAEQIEIPPVPLFRRAVYLASQRLGMVK